MSESNEERPKKNIITRVTQMLFRKSEAQEGSPKPVDPKKAAEEEEKRKKMLEAYSKLCAETPKEEPPPAKPIKFKAGG